VAGALLSGFVRARAGQIISCFRGCLPSRPGFNGPIRKPLSLKALPTKRNLRGFFIISTSWRDIVCGCEKSISPRQSELATVELSFGELISRVRNRNEQAAAELVRRYEPLIEKAVRFPLMNSGLRRYVDSQDVCQSVLISFFNGVVAGQFHLDAPDQLEKLLVRMARNKVLDEARHHRASRRDLRLTNDAADDDCLDLIKDDEPTPSKVAAGHELMAQIYGRLRPEERELAEQRAQGLDWTTIAERQGATVGALRKKLNRAIDRVTRELGLGPFHLE
jgi:RNA polymerase sigma factor (sigma-70 family)